MPSLPQSLTARPASLQAPSLLIWKTKWSPHHSRGIIISDLMHHLDTQKFMGTDGIHPKVPKELLEVLTRWHVIIYQQSWLTREIPVDWKVINVVVIHKKGLMKDPGSDRPVSLHAQKGHGENHLKCHHVACTTRGSSSASMGLWKVGPVWLT